MKSISKYFDTAAATPALPTVVEKMHTVLADNWSNPSGIHELSRSSKQLLDKMRKSIAMKIGSQSNEIIFTAGATEANALVVRGVLDRYPKGRAVISSADHAAVLRYAEDGRYADRIDICKVDENGVVDLAEMERYMGEDTVLVSIVMINSESGVRQPLKVVAALCKTIQRSRFLTEGNDSMPLHLHSDASQAALYVDLSVSRLGVDFMTINPAKAGGPKMSAVLYASRQAQFMPLHQGGGQEAGRRSGTEALHQIAGSVEAFVESRVNQKKTVAHVEQLRKIFEKALISQNEVEIVGGASRRSPHISGIIFPSIDGERFAMKMDEAGFAVATGSACSESDQSYSPYLVSMGLSKEQIRNFVRFSFHPDHTEEDIQQLLGAVQSSLKEVAGL